MAALTMLLRRILRGFGPMLLVLAVMVGVLGLGMASAGASSTPSMSSPPPTLRAPKTTTAEDTRYFSDVAEADAALASYEQKQGNVALRALLTDGSAFCALLTRSGAIDAALVEEASGVRSTEKQTHLPLSVTTFNTIESVALLTLCPSEQKLLPKSVRTKIRKLGKTLGTHAG